ncbi:MAG: PhnD/SsuA/transferrin family substrate-binding protein [Desulfovibrionaceae bacterium]
MIRVAFLLLLFTVGTLSPAFSGTSASSSPLVLGRVTLNPKKDYPKLRALATYLHDQLPDQGITSVSVAFCKTTQEMKEKLRTGEVHIISETLFGAWEFMQDGVTDPVLLEWKNGVPEYRSLIFVRDDSTIRSLDDLHGKILAFEDPDSTSAYHLPRLILERSGHNLVETPWPGERPHAVFPGKTGYIFVNEETNIPTFVLDGRVHAGALSDQDWNNPRLVPLDSKRRLRIIYTSPPLPRSLVLLSRTLDQKLAHDIIQALLQAPNSSEGRAALKAYRGVTRFDTVDAATVKRYWDTMIHDFK